MGSIELDRKSGDESVDITTVQPIPAFCSSDEDPLNVSQSKSFFCPAKCTVE